MKRSKYYLVKKIKSSVQIQITRNSYYKYIQFKGRCQNRIQKNLNSRFLSPHAGDSNVYI